MTFIIFIHLVGLAAFAFFMFKMGQMSIYHKMKKEMETVEEMMNRIDKTEMPWPNNLDAVIQFQIPPQNKETFDAIKNANCGGCLYNKQGATCCYCSHPEQKDESLKSYTYWNMSCHLHKSILNK